MQLLLLLLCLFCMLVWIAVQGMHLWLRSTVTHTHTAMMDCKYGIDVCLCVCTHIEL